MLRTIDSETNPPQTNRYLLNELPEELPISRRSEIEQGYFFNDGSTTTIIRESQEDGKSNCVVFTESKGIRDRAMCQISPQEFEKLWKETTKKLKKTILEIQTGTVLSEISVYRGELEGLMTFEVEKGRDLGHYNIQMPPWVGPDISHSPEYQEVSLALNPKPKAPNNEKMKYFKPDMETEIPQYELSVGLLNTWREIGRLFSKKKEGEIFTVGVAGGSGSGKTHEVVNFLEKKLYHKTATIPLDNYYHGATWMNQQALLGNIYNWDQPEALNLDLLRQHLEALKRGETIYILKYNFETHEPESGKEWSHYIEIDPKKVEVLILEGIFALNDCLSDSMDLKAFVNADLATRLKRRLFRDIIERGRTPESIIADFLSVVEQMHQKHVQPTITNADLIINNDYNPTFESEKSGFHEIQQKYKTNLSVSDLVNLGAKHIKTEDQTDIYYNPSDRNPVETGEILRLRTITPKKSFEKLEGKSIIFSYKGPKSTSGTTTTRPVFECYVDEESGENFQKIFTHQKKIIKKERHYFEFIGQNGIIHFTLDTVSKVVEGTKVYIGTFIEMQKIVNKPLDDKDPSNEENKHQADMEDLVNNLNLDSQTAILESYFNM